MLGATGEVNYLVVLAEKGHGGLKAFSKIIMLIFKDSYDIKCVIGLGLTRLVVPDSCSLLPGQPWSSHELAHELRLNAPLFV